jgi:hypothetical protein
MTQQSCLAFAVMLDVDVDVDVGADAEFLSFPLLRSV